MNSPFNISIDLDEPGFVHYIVVPENAPVPTPADVKAGVASGGWVVKKKASLSVVAGPSGDHSMVVSMDGSDWDSSTSAVTFRMYLVTEDADSNLAPTVTQLDIEFPDDMPPRFIQTFPRTTAVKDHDFHVAVMLTEPGTAYVLVTDRVDGDPQDDDAAAAGPTGGDLGSGANMSNTDSITPEIAQVVAGQVGATGRLILAAGALDVPLANMPCVRRPDCCRDNVRK